MPDLGANRLKDSRVKNAKANDKQYRLSDGEGLYLRVNPNGKKRWLFNYQRPVTKIRTNIILGTYTGSKSGMSLAEAREIKNEYREVLRQGIDPQDYIREKYLKKRIEHESTLEVVATEWFEVNKEQWTTSYANDVYRSLANHIFPKLGNRPISTISTQDVKDTLDPLEIEGKREMVRRVCQRLNAIFDHAIDLLPGRINPLSNIHKRFKKPDRQSFPAIEPEELPELLKTIKSANIRTVTYNLFMFQLLTLARPREAAGAKWSEIDLGKRLWTIPAERMKRGKEHIVPISKQVIEIIKDMEKRSGHLEYIFPSPHDPRKHINYETVNTVLKRNGYQGKQSGHGLRVVGSTILNNHAATLITSDSEEDKELLQNDFNPDMIEVCLAHVGRDKVRQIYNRSTYIPQRRRLMEWWGEYVTKANLKDVSDKKHLTIVK